MNRGNPLRPIGIAVGILLILTVLNAVGALRPVQSLVGLILKPVVAVFNLPDSDQTQENAELQAKVNELTAEVARREEAKRENDSLRSELNFAQANNYKLTRANIISQDPSNFQQFFTLDRGSGDGIKKGMTVVSQGLLVGRILETTATTAKVYLITDYNSAVPALTQETRASGLVRGQRGFGLELEMVAQTDQLKAGDTVITSGFGGDYPRGLVIGTITDIRQKDAEVFQSSVLRPAVDFRKLDAVFVITGTR